jgi:FKBP-type peptidyl-prolyl cis-trans isomerase
MNTLVRTVIFFLPAFLMAGVDFAAAGFITTANGLQFKDLKTGAGAAAEAGDVATLHFIGWLDDRGGKGREIYDTHRRGEPVSFVIGTDRVMPAWNEGVMGMNRAASVC